MNILLTGVSGQLGQELLPRLRMLGEVTGIDRIVADGEPTKKPQMGADVQGWTALEQSRGNGRGKRDSLVQQDLADLGLLESLLERLQPDLIVNAAAYTAVDRAEADRNAAFRINAEMPGCLAGWSSRHDSLLLHYSTDYVFSGESSVPYRENAPTGPLNEYGKTKLAGEQAVTSSGCRHLVLRTSWVYSGHGSNFVLSMLRLARERPSLNIVNDQIGCPTWARNLARVSMNVLESASKQSAESGLSGIWHYCDNDIVSWYDFARAIFEVALERKVLSRVPEITAVATSEFPQAAQRPRYSVLDTSAIRSKFGIEPVSLRASLQGCIDELGKDDEQ